MNKTPSHIPEKESGEASQDFWKFFWSTVCSIIGMDIYLFTHGWYILQLGGNKLAIGTSWAMFFLPSILMLPACSRLLRDHSVRKVQLGFEIAKALMLWVAIAWLTLRPSVWSLYTLSICFGLLFAPFYPATYALLKGLFNDERVVRYSNLFEVSLQLSGAGSLLVSGIIYEKIGFVSIVWVAAISVSASCVFLYSMSERKTAPKKAHETWLQTYLWFFKAPEPGVVRDRRFWLGLIHQVPQSVVLLSNIPLVVYVSQKMGAGPKLYGYLDSLYAVVGLTTSLIWSKANTRPLHAQGLWFWALAGATSFTCLAVFPAPVALAAFFIGLLSGTMTSIKLASRSTYIRLCSQEFITRYTPTFQLFSNLALIVGCFAMGGLMQTWSVDAANICLASVMIVFAFGYAGLRAGVSEREPC